MRALRSNPRLLGGLGFAVILIGLAVASRPINDIVQEALGHCDYVPCVTSTTVPVLAASLAVVVVGALVVVAGARNLRRR